MQSNTTRRLLWGLGIVAVVLWQAGAAHATTAPTAPEISPSSLSAGVALLAGGVLIVRAMRRR
jgi:hypothetical protein